ncbi:MAG: prolyl oligopeptidase family serine peptidase [Spirosomataceae bacterium]
MTKRTLYTVVFVLIGYWAMAQKPTLEQFMSYSFPSELSPAPVGNKVAWVQNDKGIRNIFIAQAPDFQGKKLTNYTQDDGQELSSLTWSPNGQTLLYVRGGAPNRVGEYPNPTSDANGAEQALWKITIDNGQSLRIGLGSAPAISPKGDSVVYVYRGQVQIASLETGKTRLLFQSRGGNNALRWSPDGSKLAFVSNRGDHSFVGIYDFASRKIKFLSPSTDFDLQPVWSPDGSKIAFMREPAAEPVIFVPVREAEPWSLMVVEVVTGKTQEVWKADKGVGSAFREIVAENQLFWLDGNRLVFPWEKTGWNHLYSLDLTTKTVTQLTKGNFEVEYVTPSPDNKSLIINSNQDDIDRRHLWEVSPTSKAPVLLTPGKNIEWEGAYLSDGKTLVYLQSGAKSPASAVVMVNGKAQSLLPQPFEVKPEDLVEPEAVIISATDGMQIPCQLFVPKDLKKGEKRPAAIFFHGGSRRQMLLGYHYGLYYHHAYALNQYLASLGYIVLSVNYRSGIGYGMEFREAIHFGADGVSEYNDVMGAGLYLRNRADVDGSKIGLWGGSYGGYLTAFGLARSSNLFAAGVDIHGVHDENLSIKNFIPSYNYLEQPARAQIAELSSPMHYIDTWKSPVLVIHGDDDRNVNFYQTVMLIRELRKRNVETEQLVFPDEVHSFLTHQHWVDAYKATIDFFGRKLK